MPATWLKQPVRDRDPETPADRAAIQWLAAQFGPEPFTPTEAWRAAARFYAGRGGSKAVYGVPEGLPAWQARLRSLYFSGLVETRGGRYRLDPVQRKLLAAWIEIGVRRRAWAAERITRSASGEGASS